jgi:hypothetical protein
LNFAVAPFYFAVYTKTTANCESGYEKLQFLKSGLCGIVVFTKVKEEQ